eukprot:Phypoly_transcript_07896.p1 GENE.Phypoly_transcript_07896~~Phypoly_transcript_07896.p1  ORF type:complete len:297 (-),score=50.57 Phypoly_transcript_07896:472-1362(-)
MKVYLVFVLLFVISLRAAPDCFVLSVDSVLVPGYDSVTLAMLKGSYGDAFRAQYNSLGIGFFAPTIVVSSNTVTFGASQCMSVNGSLLGSVDASGIPKSLSIGYTKLGFSGQVFTTLRASDFALWSSTTCAALPQKYTLLYYTLLCGPPTPFPSVSSSSSSSSSTSSISSSSSSSTSSISSTASSSTSSASSSSTSSISSTTSASTSSLSTTLPSSTTVKPPPPPDPSPAPTFVPTEFTCCSYFYPDNPNRLAETICHAVLPGAEFCKDRYHKAYLGEETPVSSCDKCSVTAVESA